MSRLAASASGASGAHSCQAAIVATGSSQNVSNAVIAGASTVSNWSAVDDAEARATRSAQRPEQVGVGLHHAPVGEHHLGREQRVRQQPVETAEDPEPAAEREPGDTDVRRSRRGA